MRRFHFRLETVLRHRELIESLREQDFQSAQGVVLTLEASLRAMDQKIRDTIAGRPGSLPGERIDPAQILDRERYLLTLREAMDRLEQQLEAARIVMEERRLILVEARKAHKSVENLRDKDLIAYMAESLLTEQAALDEMATIRFNRTSPQAETDA